MLKEGKTSYNEIKAVQLRSSALPRQNIQLTSTEPKELEGETVSLVCPSTSLTLSNDSDGIIVSGIESLFRRLRPRLPVSHLCPHLHRDNRFSPFMKGSYTV